MAKKRINYRILIISFSITSLIIGEVNTSESFKKIAENIIKENIKQTILKTFDPISGIIAADLIEQAVNGMDKTEITKSAIDVAYTLAYLYAIRPEIELLLSQHPEILKQAENMGYKKEQLIGYSCLYFYYSEKIKYNYIISPEIIRLSKQKSFISALQINTGKKWVSLIAGELVKKRREQNKYIYDIRLNEFIRYSTKVLLIYPDSTKTQIPFAIKNLVNQYHDDEKEKIQKIVGKIDSTINIYTASQNVFNLYNQQFKKNKADTTSFESDILNAITVIFNQQYFNKAEISENIFQTVTMILNDFLNKGLKNKKGLQYIISLAGTIYPNPAFSDTTRLDFTVLDQIRYQVNRKSGIYFIYLGGFVDPILKSTIYKKGTKLYQAGLGWQNGNIYFTINAGMPYPEFKARDISAGISIGYEIPLSQLINK
jgi:hypothetical protein